VQKTVLRGLEKIHLWQPGTDLRAWLFTLMHNEYVTLVRKAVREGKSAPIESARRLGSPAPQMDGLLLRDLKRALDRLSDEQRSVVLMIGLDGMNYDEVAQALNVPVGTVRSRLSRARETMRLVMDAPERRKVPAPRAGESGGAELKPRARRARRSAGGDASDRAPAYASGAAACAAGDALGIGAAVA
jgi:RNA polymerase sigma-70 factor (ECF subfamily)